MIWVLSALSFSCGKTSDSPAARRTTTAIEVSSVVADWSSGRKSPYAIPTAMPWMGVASGAMTIAPITVAVESETIPAVAITAESVSKSQKRVCFAATSPVNRYAASRISSGLRPSLVSRLAMCDARGMSLARPSTA